MSKPAQRWVIGRSSTNLREDEEERTGNRPFFFVL
jgi:hypothetical protein